MKVEINIERIHYLLALFKMSEEGLLSILNEKRKILIERKEVFGNTIEISLLKKIDKVFQRGLQFYYDFTPLKPSKEYSVFFRKSQFGIEPNIETIRVVQKFEGLKDCLDAYSALSENRIQPRKIRFMISDDPQKVAIEVRELFHPGYNKNKRKFLKAMIDKCADNGIYVFEFIETWNKKECVNIDGLFISSNMIVLKHQKWLKREIFTLAHEIGHFLLGIEEVEPLDIDSDNFFAPKDDIERWCNDFAFHFIVGEEADVFIEIPDSADDYYHDKVKYVAEHTLISREALYTYLFYCRKISKIDYDLVREALREQYAKSKTIEKDDKNKDTNKNFRPSKPIISKLFLETMQIAFYKGIINEATFCKQLNVNPAKVDKYLC